MEECKTLLQTRLWLIEDSIVPSVQNMLNPLKYDNGNSDTVVTVIPW